MEKTLQGIGVKLDLN